MKKTAKTPAKHRIAPSQPRSRQKVEFIIEAATRILRSQGIAGFTTNRIAEVAGVSIGSLYQYFRDKDAILEVIVQRHLDEIGAIAQSGSSEQSDDAAKLTRLDELIDAAVAAHARDPALHRAISAIPDYPARFQRISQAKQQLDVNVQQALQQLLAQMVPTADKARLPAAALLLHSLVESTVHRAVAEERDVYDIVILSAELKRAVRLYVESL
ncbi:MAG TPA: helix-turn-helix domain-containing protein [Dongiaceae bacterium]|nr:helix-turn-helix domain-containing protein [Dongiaceae bacterium]